MADTTLDFTECYAVPGAGHIIDVINPATGLTFVNGKTEADVIAEYPDARRMQWSDWQAARAAEQQRAIFWDSVSEAIYERMLNCLPPVRWDGDSFMVGEPEDHCMATGAPRFRAYRKHGSGYLSASRPMTVAEFLALRRNHWQTSTEVAHG